MTLIGTNELLAPGKPVRDIQTYYQIQSISANIKDLAHYQGRVLASQMELARRSIDIQADSNKQLTRMAGEVLDSLASIGDGIDRIDQTLSDLSLIVEHGLYTIASKMDEQTRLLADIAEILRRPYETKALELRTQARTYLLRGMHSSGRDQTDDWEDSFRLFQATMANPIGMQDFLAWFDLSWLHWRLKDDLQAAEEGFYRTQRLSGTGSPLYATALRHLAYMQYLQNNREAAYQTSVKLLVASSDWQCLYDAARYAALTERRDQQIALLDRAIDANPLVVVIMMSEPDFK